MIPLSLPVVLTLAYFLLVLGAGGVTVHRYLRRRRPRAAKVGEFRQDRYGQAARDLELWDREVSR